MIVIQVNIRKNSKGYQGFQWECKAVVQFGSRYVPGKNLDSSLDPGPEKDCTND
jgi:hypothetical protein